MEGVSCSGDEHPVLEAIRTELFGASAEEFADVVLESKDGHCVPTVRALLAARSPVFRRMLFGPFAEATSKTVHLNIRGDTLHVLVEFILLDDAALFREQATDHTMRALVDLMVVGEFFAVPGLTARACAIAQHAIAANPARACVTLEAARACGGRALLSGGEGKDMDVIATFAFNVIRDDPSTALLCDTDSDVCQLSATSLKDVLSDTYTTANEMLLFRALQRWAGMHKPGMLTPDGSGEGSHKGEEDNKIEADVSKEGDVGLIGARFGRWAQAKELAVHLDLFRMPPSFLSNVVLSSGLVPRESVFNAFKHHAEQAEMRHSHEFGRECRRPVWETSGEDVFEESRSAHGVELLRCGKLTSGVYSWTLEVLNLCEYFWVGVVSGNVNTDEWLGKQMCGWAYGNNGAACHATAQDNGPYDCIWPTFNQGDEITLTLDLTHTGTLSVAVNGGASHTIFYDMKQTGEVVPQFVPAVSIFRPGCVGLTSFTREEL